MWKTARDPEEFATGWVRQEMKYVRLSHAPRKANVILSRILGGGVSALSVYLLVYFLRQDRFFYLGPVAAGWILLLSATAIVGLYSMFQKKGLYFRCQWPEEEPLPPVGERLKELQSLYDQGLVTAEEYEQKRQEILKKL